VSLPVETRISCETTRIYKCLISTQFYKLLYALRNNNNNKTPWPFVRKQTIPTERPPLVSEVSANFSLWFCMGVKLGL
jgi:hypothetical protein